MRSKSAGSGGRWRVLAFVFAVLLASCRSAPPAQRYALEGQVVRLDAASGQAVIQHGSIPGYMGAMTMGFVVRSREQFGALQPGQHIRATLVVRGTDSALEDVQILDDAPAQDLSAPGAFHMPTAGEAAPDFAFTDQDGHAARFSRYRGKAVLLSFIYTRCPLPEFCPRITSSFRAVESALAQDSSLYGKTQLVVVTLDPAFDTPAVLRQYGMQAGGLADFRHWQFLHVDAKPLQPVTRFYGLSLSNEDGQIVHSLSTAVITPGGKIYSWYHGNGFTNDAIVHDLRAAAAQ